MEYVVKSVALLLCVTGKMFHMMIRTRRTRDEIRAKAHWSERDRIFVPVQVQE